MTADPASQQRWETYSPTLAAGQEPITFKVATLMHQALHRRCPAYFNQSINQSINQS